MSVLNTAKPKEGEKTIPRKARELAQPRETEENGYELNNKD